MTLSTRAKVAIGTVLTVGVVLLVAGGLALRAVAQIELGRSTEDLESRAGLVSVSLQPLLEERGQPVSLPALHAKVHEAARQAHAQVSVIAPDGQVLADSGADDLLGHVINEGNRPEVIQAFQTGRGSTIRRSERTGERLLYVAIRLGSDADAGGLVRVASPLTTLETNTAKLKHALIIALVVGLLSALALSPLLARSLTRPLSEMATVARQFADGSLSQRVTTRQRDEVGVLASTLNRMADQLEATLKEVSEDRAQLRATLTSMVEGVMVLDSEGTVLQINPALERMLLTRGTKARGRPHWEIIRHHELNELASRVLETTQNQSGEITILPSGRTFQVEASVAGGRGPSEACAVLVFHDVTVLRRLEKVRKDFVANVSHELRTPLTSIQGYAQALKDGAIGSPGQAGTFLDIILKQSDRLNLILDDLLQLSHIESGEVVFKRERVALPALAERSVAVIKPQAEKNGHAVIVSIPSDLPPALGDEERLVQVLTNLLDNAVKYTPAHGTISVAAGMAKDTETDMVELTITDTGIGIPEADRPRIFERFYRVDKARSRELGGTGLGLSIVKHIVERHSGRVWVEGNHPKGSRFVVRLPAALAHGAG